MLLRQCSSWFSTLFHTVENDKYRRLVIIAKTYIVALISDSSSVFFGFFLDYEPNTCLTACLLYFI